MMTPRPNRTRAPKLDQNGMAEHGSDWNEGVVLRAQSRGAGVPVEVRPPRPGPVRRVVSGSATAYTRGGKLFVVPTAGAGEDVQITVEF
jgi:hypothetical protein